jgi:hypothetical protein
MPEALGYFVSSPKRWWAAVTLLAAVAAAPGVCSAQSSTPTAASRVQYIAFGFGQFAIQTAPYRWTVLDRPATELSRNSDTLEIQDTAGEKYVFDFTKSTALLTNTLTSATTSVKITASAAVNGFMVSAFSVKVPIGNKLTYFAAHEQLVNGVSQNWTFSNTDANGNAIASQTVLSKDVVRSAEAISLTAADSTLSVNVISRTCTAQGVQCTLLDAQSTTGFSVGSMTAMIRVPNFLYQATLVQTTTTNWSVVLNGQTATMTEVGRTLNYITLADDTRNYRLYTNGSGLVETGKTGQAWTTDSDMNVINATAAWPGQLSGTYVAPAPGESPGFQIINATDLPVLVTLEQVGCLYYGIVQPGKTFQRDTGAVWFTIKASIAPGIEEPTVASCIEKPAVYVAGVVIAGATAGAGLEVSAALITAAGYGASYGVQAGVAAGGGSQTQLIAAKVGMMLLTNVTNGAFQGAAMGGGFTPMALSDGLKNALVDPRLPQGFLARVGGGIVQGLNTSYKAYTASDLNNIKPQYDAFVGQFTQTVSVAGAYAGYPWPWPKSDRVMPRYIITGGPMVAQASNGITLMFPQKEPLKLTKQ